MKFVFASVTGWNNVASGGGGAASLGRARLVAPHSGGGNADGDTVSDASPFFAPAASRFAGEAEARAAASAARAEALLIAGAKRGERAAFGQIYEAHHREVYWLCRRIVGRDADAEDALQATFVKAFTGLTRFRGDCALRTWLYRIAVNEATTLLRQRAAFPLAPLGDGGDLDSAAPLRPRGGADEAATLAERLAVRDLMETLKPDHRAILALRFWEELSYEEIAHVLNLSLPAMKMRLRRAKAEFRALWETDENALRNGNGEKEAAR